MAKQENPEGEMTLKKRHHGGPQGCESQEFIYGIIKSHGSPLPRIVIFQKARTKRPNITENAVHKAIKRLVEQKSVQCHPLATHPTIMEGTKVNTYSATEKDPEPQLFGEKRKPRKKKEAQEKPPEVDSKSKALLRKLTAELQFGVDTQRQKDMPYPQAIYAWLDRCDEVLAEAGKFLVPIPRSPKGSEE